MRLPHFFRVIAKYIQLRKFCAPQLNSVPFILLSFTRFSAFAMRMEERKKNFMKWQNKTKRNERKRKRKYVIKRE